MKVQKPSVRRQIGRRWLKRLICSCAGRSFFDHGAPAPSPNRLPSRKSRRCTWTNGPWADPNFFPIAVWLQDPAYAERYRQAGINTYAGLWEGPTEDQLAALKKAGMWVVCEQNETGRRHRDDPAIIAWMHGDEPDNGRSWGARFGFGSPIPPEKIVEDYRRMKAVDASRPILLTLGQGVAWDGWYGRGKRNHHPEDYPEYLKGCDIASFDIYPVNHDSREVHGNLWFVANGVERLVQWGQGRKMVWNCHRMHRHCQSEKQAHAATGPRRSLDVAHPWLARSDLLRPSIQTQV